MRVRFADSFAAPPLPSPVVCIPRMRSGYILAPLSYDRSLFGGLGPMWNMPSRAFPPLPVSRLSSPLSRTFDGGRNHAGVPRSLSAA